LPEPRLVDLARRLGAAGVRINSTSTRSRWSPWCWWPWRSQWCGSGGRCI